MRASLADPHREPGAPLESARSAWIRDPVAGDSNPRALSHPDAELDIRRWLVEVEPQRGNDAFRLRGCDRLFGECSSSTGNVDNHPAIADVVDAAFDDKLVAPSCKGGIRSVHDEASRSRGDKGVALDASRFWLEWGRIRDDARLEPVH